MITIVSRSALVAASALLFSAVTPALAQSPTVVVQWNNAILNAIVATSTPPTVAARALAIVHTAMYDAWAVYDPVAIGTQPTSPRQANGSQDDKTQAISYAAYETLLDLFPTQKAAFDAVMQNLGFDPTLRSGNPMTPEGVGTFAATAILTFRHEDGSNQLGDLGSSVPYSDYTGYTAVNFPESLVDAPPTGPC
jgi:hypothetical protein